MNDVIKNKPVLFVTCFIAALLFALLVQGAIPFLTAPTLGQAVWATGFSQSFANDSVFSIYARNFGAPEPAAIAFGLSSVWPAALFIRAGITPIDAYTMMAMLWSTVAFFSAYKIGRYFNVSPFSSILGALTWMTMPIIWVHTGYSMLSLGISLLPFYFLAAFRLFSVDNKSLKKLNAATMVARYLFVCIVSIFMDGYSFMMFAVGSTIWLATVFCRADRAEKIFLCKFSSPVHFICLGVAYLLFSAFIGKTQYASAPIDFFRGWGVDVVFMLIPTKGMHWIMDLIGGSVSRSDKYFWGDSSVWKTSFCVPIILVFMISLWKSRLENKKFIGFILVAMFGFYMALGPSLKFNSVKPIGHETGQTMSAEYALAPTGSSVLSANFPGFSSMRASYRWLALGVFGAWIVSLALLVTQKGKYKIYGNVLLCVVVLLNIPDLSKKLNGDINRRDSFFAVEHDFIDKMAIFVSPGDKLAFLPWGNDFLANYTASKLKVISYNIGGDKNLDEARRHWPTVMRQFPRVVDELFADRVLLLLAKREADVVVLPYIDMLWAAHSWPYPPSLKETMMPIVSRLSRYGVMEVIEDEYFAAVKLSYQGQDMELSEILKESEWRCVPPICLEQDGFSASSHTHVGVLKNAWLESAGSRGMLHHGPYVAMDSGNYHLTVYGTAKTTGSAWADVVSDGVRKVHGRFKLVEKDEASDQILVDALVALDHDVSDIQIRVYVESEDEVSLRGFSLKQ